VIRSAYEEKGVKVETLVMFAVDYRTVTVEKHTEQRFQMMKFVQSVDVTTLLEQCGWTHILMENLCACGVITLKLFLQDLLSKCLPSIAEVFPR
jgi:hypothetical protein